MSPQPPPPPERSGRRRPSLPWIAGLVFILLAAAAASIVELTAEGSDDERACRDRVGSRAALPEKRPAPAKGQAVPVDSEGGVERDANLKFAFGSSREPIEQDQAFRVPAGVPRAEFRAGVTTSLSDVETDRAVAADRPQWNLLPVRIDRSLVRVVVCIDPGEPSELKPGTYSGSLVVNAPRVRRFQPASLPMTVTVRDDMKILAMLAALIGVLAGLAVRTYADLKQAPGQGVTGSTDRGAYLYSFRFLVMFAGGLIGGALTYGGLYADDPAATTDLFSSLVPLAGGSFAATLAAKSLADIYPPSEKERAAGVAGAPLR